MSILGQLEKLNTAPPNQFQAEVNEVTSFLLNRCQLVVGNSICRLVELELYYYSKNHPDPFVHQDPLQKKFGGWYLHRKGGTLKNGTFKGIDLTFGTAENYAAFLIRSIKDSNGEIIDGSCLCVEYMMKMIGVESVSKLQLKVEGAGVTSTENPLRLEILSKPITPNLVFCSPRVGLTLKGKASNLDARKYLVSKYRFLTEPKRVKKGRAELIYGLVDSGIPTSEIRQLTGSPTKLIDKYYFSKNAEQNFEMPKSGIVKPTDFWALANCNQCGRFD